MIRFACPDCGKGYSVKNELAGKRTRCLACKASLTVPASSEPEILDVVPAAAPPPILDVVPVSPPAPAAPAAAFDFGAALGIDPSEPTVVCQGCHRTIPASAAARYDVPTFTSGQGSGACRCSRRSTIGIPSCVWHACGNSAKWLGPSNGGT
jgi:hypothetical protein